MGFRGKILVALAAVGIVPILLLGWLSYRSSRAELRKTSGELQAQRASELVRYSGKVTTDIVASLQLTARTIPFSALSPAEITDVLRIPYQQFPLINVVGVFDATGGAVANPVLRRADDATPGIEAHEIIGDGDLQVFVRNVPPLPAIVENGAAVGPPYRAGDGNRPRVAVGVRLSGEPLRVLIAEVSLRELATRVETLREQGYVAFVTNGKGEAFVASESGRDLDQAERELIESARESGEVAVAELEHADGTSWLAAAAVMPDLGWAVVLEQSATIAFAGARRLRQYTLIWTGVVLLLLLLIGVPLSRSLTEPIRALSAAVSALARGKYDQPVELSRNDEIGRFAETFNQMATEIQERDREIREWNEQLRARVEERTAELEQAQEQIRRSERLTALGTLGAGVAHELNNPLTGLVTLLPLVQRDVADNAVAVESLEMAIEQARRISRIVADFRGFVDRQTSTEGVPLSALAVVKGVVTTRAHDLAEKTIALSLHHSEAIPELQGQLAELQQALDNVVRNAIEAMESGGHLSVDVAGLDGKAVRIRVSDTGPGIPEEVRDRIFDPFYSRKESNSGTGLGLSVAHSIIEAHGGSITLESDTGSGAVFAIVLPAAASAAHLR